MGESPYYEGTTILNRSYFRVITRELGSETCPACKKHLDNPGKAIWTTHTCFEVVRKIVQARWRPYVKKPPLETAPSGAAVPLNDEGFVKKYPLIYEHLTEVKWDDGTAREPSTMSIFVEEGRFKAALNDKATRRSLYVSGERFQDALGALEKALGSQTPDWRVWKGGKQKK